jgi:hypothetical protein
MLSAPIARADETPVAEQLFLEGKRLMGEKRYDEACAKFKASHDLDPTATGTLLNLALCHEQVGKVATAWAELRQVAAESVGRREDRVAMANEHIAKLVPVLSYVTIVVPQNARAGGLVVALDTTRIADAAWGTELPIDPGAHEIATSAPGKIGARRRIEIRPNGAHERVVLEPLADVPREPEPPRPAEPEGSQRTVGFLVGGAGIAAAGAGVVFGVLAKNLDDKAKARCPDDRCASPEDAGYSNDEHDASKRWANVANVAVAVGVLAIAGGIVLVLTAKRADVSAQGRSLVLGGRF